MAQITDHEDLQRWLEDKPREVAVAIAARSALRVLPLLSEVAGPRHVTSYASDIVLPVFRAMATFWVAATAAATTAVRAAVTTTLWRAVSSDCDTIESELDASGLASRPLWPVEPPRWAMQEWQRLKTALYGRNEDWEVWTSWYEARLHGRAANQKLEVARVTEITVEEWSQGPKTVDARIREMMEEYGEVEPPLPGDDEAIFGQLPASYSYGLRGNKITAYPQRGESLDAAAVSDILPDLQEKAQDYCQELESASNSPPRLLRTASGLKDVLLQWEETPKPGVLLMKLRSLEGDLVAYDTPEGRAELFPDAIASMADLQASVNDLISLYPMIQKMQASALALNIQKADVVNIHSYLIAIEEASADGTLVDDTVREALSEGRAEVEDATQIIETSSDERKVSDAIEQRGEKTAFRVLSARNFTSALLRAVQDGTVDGVKGGVKAAVSGGVKAGFALLVGTLAGPVAGIATFVASWKPFAKRAEELKNLTDSNDEEE